MGREREGEESEESEIGAGFALGKLMLNRVRENE
jgi:hypothetical protein